MALTKAQRRKVARRTTPSSKARLRQRFRKQNASGGNEQESGLYDPSVQLSGRQLKRAARQLTGIEFGSARASLDREMEQATAQGGELSSRASDYYTQLAREQEGLVARQQAIGAELGGKVKAIGEEGQQALSAVEQEAARRAAADEAVRGTGLSGGGDERVAAEIAAARGLATNRSGAAQEAAALQSANYAGLTNLANTARGMAGGETLSRLQTGLANTQNDIRSRRATLDEQVAEKRAANLIALRQQSFENQVTAEGLGIDMAKIKADVSSDRADRRLARERIRSAERQTQNRLDVTMRGQDMSAEQRAADRRARERISSARKKGTKLESSDARKLKMGISNAIADLSSTNPKNPERWLRRRDAPGIVVKAATEVRKSPKGWLQPSTVVELRQLGVRIPSKWVPPSMRRGYSPGSSGIPHNKV